LQLTQKIHFINDLETSETDFVNVFTKDWNNHDSEIHIDCETTQFTYLIGKIKFLFKDFTFTNIEKSKNFLSKNGTILKQTNLSKQKSVSKDIGVKKQSDIDKIIKNIPKE